MSSPVTCAKPTPDCACSVCWSCRQAIPHSPSPCRTAGPSAGPIGKMAAGSAVPVPSARNTTRPGVRRSTGVVDDSETHALCARARSIPAGGLTHAPLDPRALLLLCLIRAARTVADRSGPRSPARRNSLTVRRTGTGGRTLERLP